MFFPHLSYVLCCCIYRSKDLEQTMLVNKPVELFYSDHFVAHKSVLVWKYRHAILKKIYALIVTSCFLYKYCYIIFPVLTHVYLFLLLKDSNETRLKWWSAARFLKKLIICLIMIWRKLYIVNRKSKILQPQH